MLVATGDMGVSVVYCREWCGECYAAKKCHGPSCRQRGGRVVPSVKRRLRMVLSRKDFSPGSVDPDLTGPVGGAFGSQFPTLWEFLTSVVWDDGTARVPGSLKIQLKDGRLTAMLVDLDGGNIVFRIGNTVEGLLGCLDAGLAEGSLDWRRDRFQGSKRKK